MIEHRQSAHPLDAVVSRSRRFRVRRHVAEVCSASIVIGLAAVLGLAIVKPKPITITVAGPAPQTAGYIAVESGGYEGEGNWQLTILRGEERLELTSATSPSCGPIGTIKPGDKVTGEISDPQSLLAQAKRHARTHSELKALSFLALRGS